MHRTLATVNRRRALPLWRGGGGASAPRGVSLLPPQSELGDERPVPLDVVASEVVEQPAPPAHEHQQTPARVMVLAVDLQVLREVVDAIREQCDLHLRRSGVGVVPAVLGDRGGGVGHAFSEVEWYEWISGIS